MAKRYSQQKKDEVVRFVKAYNKSNGRGGQSAAVAKWSLNPITVKSWLDKAGVVTPGNQTFQSPRRASSASKVTDSKVHMLRRMAEIKEAIQELEAEYNSLKMTL